MPLAVSDAQSVMPEQLVPSDLVYPDRIGETYSVDYTPPTAGTTFRMKTDEVLLFKC